MRNKGAEPVYEFEVTKKYVYNPEKVEEGYRLLDEYLVEMFLKKQQEKLNRKKKN